MEKLNSSEIDDRRPNETEIRTENGTAAKTEGPQKKEIKVEK